MAAKRAYEYRLRLTQRNILSFKLRKFRTNRANRSKKDRQIVIPLAGFFAWRELTLQRKIQLHDRGVAIHYNHITNIMLFVGLTGLLSFGALYIHKDKLVAASPVTYVAPAQQQKADTPKLIAMDKSEPVAINIPAISLDADVTKVGQQYDGSIQMPSATKYITGWYKNSPPPGEIGPSVIVGHVDNLKGPSVFWNLRKLAAGDLIKISRADGSTATFAVIGIEMFSQNSFPSGRVYGNTDSAELRLITCGGTFSRSSGQYSDNLVVFARLTDTK